MVERIKHPKHEVRIAVVGKYMKHRDAYKSVYEALDHAGIANRARVLVVRVEAEEVDSRGAEAILAGVDGILVPGGFGMRGIEGKIEAIRYARTQQHPLFRHLPGHAVRRRRVRPRASSGSTDANSTEFDQTTEHPVICADGGAAVGPRARRHDAAGRLALRPGARAAWPVEAYGVDQIQRAAPAPLRAQQRLPASVRGARAGRRPASAPTARSSRSWS